MRTFAWLMAMFMVQSFSILAQEVGQAHIYIFKPDSSMYQGVKVSSGTQSVLTDESGFALLNLPEGENVLAFEVEGKVVTELKIDITASEVSEAMLTLGQQKKALEMEILSEEEEANKVSAEDLDVGDKWGNIEGTIKDSKTGNPVSAARIFVRGVNAESNTDANGVFNIKLPIGTFSISIIHPEYATETIDDILIEENKVTKITRELLPSAIELDAISVVAVKITGGVAALVTERRESKQVLEIIGAEQMSKSGDSDAAAALKRVPGLTVVGGKYVYVRGMGDRYSSAFLNGGFLPSPVIEKRVVPLNLFPADVIDSLVIQKTASADSPGEFSGGHVKIRTKNIPEKRTIKFGLSYGMNSETTGDQIFVQKSESGDEWGNGSAARELPPEATATILNGYTDQQRGLVASRMRNIYTPTQKKAKGNSGMSFEYGDRYEISKNPIGFTFSMGYSNSTSSKTVDRQVLITQALQGGATETNSSSEATETVEFNSLFALGTTLKENHDLKYTFFGVRTTDSFAGRAEGYIGTAANFNPPAGLPRVIQYNISYTEQQLLTHGFGGTHKNLFGKEDWIFTWDLTTSKATSDMPDWREHKKKYDGQYVTQLTAPDVKIRATDIVEENDEYNLRFEIPLGVLDSSKLTLGLGALEKGRDSRTNALNMSNGLNSELPTGTRNIEDYFVYTNLAHITPPLLDVVNGQYEGMFVTGLQTTDIFNYSTVEQLDYSFAMFDLTYDQFDLNLGVRLEDYKADISAFSNTGGLFSSSGYEEDEAFPSMTATWRIRENHQLRAGYSQSVNRPTSEELAPVIFPAVLGGTSFEGNPNLRPAELENYDLRYEWYLTPSDTLALSLFYKDMSKPIEKYYQPAAEGGINRIFNAEEGTVYGLEFEARKSLDFLLEAWKDGYFSTNFALIDSEVNIDPSLPVTNKSHALLGQSPMVANFTLGYDNPETGFNTALLYNFTDEKIDSLGTESQGNVPNLDDVYESASNKLDFVLKAKFKKSYSVSFKANNILNEKVELSQNGIIIESYKPGPSYSFGAGISF